MAKPTFMAPFVNLSILDTLLPFGHQGILIHPSRKREWTIIGIYNTLSDDVFES